MRFSLSSSPDRPENMDHQRIAVIRSDDAAAARSEFDALYKESYPLLLDFAFRYVQSRDVAHDVVQEVFVSLWLRRKNWEPRGSITAYLYGATRLRAIDVTKRDKSLRTMDTQSDDHAIPTVSHDEHIEQQQTHSVLRRAIDNLPERQRDAVLLCYGRGLTIADAARVLGVSHTATTNLVNRALARLKEMVQRDN